MHDPPPEDNVRSRMQGMRCDIDRDLEDVAASARSLVDWKHYVKTYPWVCLGAAVAAGFLLVPKKSKAIHSDLATLTELAKTGQLVVTPARTARRGLVDALLAAVATAAFSTVTAYVGQKMGSLLGITDQPETGRHDSNGAP